MYKMKKMQKLEIGQVIPLVVLMMFAIIAMVALVLDGGSVISNRRTAQAAADAGALAGAQRACYGFGDAGAVAISYATNNGATSVEVPVVSNSQVTVVATVENDSFFARIFGETSLTATAQATAGCYAAMGRGIAPLAFHCEANTIGGALPNPNMYDCIMLGMDWKTELKPLLNGQTININATNYNKSGANILDSSGIPPVNKMYIIMDTKKVCASEGGTYQCDLDGDGKNELKFGGHRSWLYPTKDTNSIVQFIKNMGGPKSNVNIRGHKWLSGDSGTMTSGYNHMIKNGWIGNIVLIPVYNYLCPGDPRTDAACVSGAHASPWPSEPPQGDDFSDIRNKKDNYHIIAFVPFYISCIDTKANCPGYQYARTLDPKLDKNESVIEGFFITGYDDIMPDSTSMCDLNLGNCVISLSN